MRLRSSPRTLTPSFLLSSKSLARLGCSLINALTTPHCRYQLFAVSGGQADFFFTNRCRCRLFLIRAEIFPLVGNAHRAFRGGKRAHVPCGRSTGKHDIVEKIHNKIFQSMQCPSVDSSSRTAHRLRLRSSSLCSLRRSSSPKKVTPRLCCSLVNALATRRLATNFFRYQEVRYCAFSLVGNAHRAFRGGKRAHVPCGWSTGKHDIVEKIYNKIFQSMQCPSVDGRFCYNQVYLSAVGAGAPTLRFKRIGFRLHENTCANALRFVDR